MPPIHTDALILRTYKMGETSNVVVLLTRERGKVRAVAKGTRGPKARHQAALQPLSEVRVGLYGRQGADLLKMGGCELIRSAFAFVNHRALGEVRAQRSWIFYGDAAPTVARRPSTGQSALAIARAARRP